MGSKQLDVSWQGWVQDNLARGCSADEILGILLRNAFSADSIQQSMGEHFPEHSALLAKRIAPIDYQALASVRLTQPHEHNKARRIPSDLLQIYELDDFLTAQECDEIAAISVKSLRPSTISLPGNDKYFRTSSTCDLSLIQNPVILALDQKIATTLGVQLSYSEGIQAQRYEVGQEFKAHTDYFEPATNEYVQFCSALGNRTWTFMVYLNDVSAGGGTRFSALGRTIIPKKGKAVVWNNLHSDGSVNPDTVHAGMPVEQGHKLIITKWFREKGKGPMLGSMPED